MMQYINKCLSSYIALILKNFCIVCSFNICWFSRYVYRDREFIFAINYKYLSINK